jgi:glutamate--cysteine ligase
MVPHLVTALSGPLATLEARLIALTPQIERWFRLEWQEHTPPFYSSVALRNAGFKLAAVDTNLFPSGFNHLDDAMLPLAVQAATSAIEKYCPDAKNLLLIPETNLSDPLYFANVLRLAAILRQTGLTVRFGSIDPELKQPTTHLLPDGRQLIVEPLVRRGRRVGLTDFDPCTILLNNDLSQGSPIILKGLVEQVLLPPLHAGWAARRKTAHFSAYSDVVKSFAKFVEIDPWLLTPYFASVEQTDFQDSQGQSLLAQRVDTLLQKIRTKYKKYGISNVPFVVLKTDTESDASGTISVKEGAELMQLNEEKRRQLITLASGSNSAIPVMIQEGVPTIETVDTHVAEPVVYLVDKFVVGGFYRFNAQPQNEQDMQLPGADFRQLPFAKPCNMPDCGEDTTAAPNRFYAYGVVARLAALAASLELERTDPDQSQYG